jgi:hypothetical protein
MGSPVDIARSIYVTYLVCSRADAKLVAQTWLEERGASSGWMWLTAFHEGIILEVHDGGPGRAFVPTMLAEGREDAILHTAEHDLVVELSGATVHTLRIDHDPEASEEPIRASELMQRITLDPSPYFLFASIIALLLSVATVSFAVVSRPAAEPVVIPQINTDTTPLQWWKSNAHWGRFEQPVRVTFENGAWSLEKESVDAQ